MDFEEYMRKEIEELKKYFEKSKEYLDKSGLSEIEQIKMMAKACREADRRLYPEHEEWDKFKKENNREHCSDEDMRKSIANAILIQELTECKNTEKENDEGTER